MPGKTHGRGVQLFFVADGASVYSQIGNLIGDLNSHLMRDAVDSSGHGDTLQTHVFDPLLKLPVWTLQGNYDEDLASHDEATGLIKLVTDGTATSLQLRGANFSAPSTDLIQASGQILTFDWIGPNEGVYNFTSSFQPDGSDLQINGVVKT